MLRPANGHCKLTWWRGNPWLLTLLVINNAAPSWPAGLEGLVSHGISCERLVRTNQAEGVYVSTIDIEWIIYSVSMVSTHCQHDVIVLPWRTLYRTLTLALLYSGIKMAFVLVLWKGSDTMATEVLRTSSSQIQFTLVEEQSIAAFNDECNYNPGNLG